MVSDQCREGHGKIAWKPCEVCREELLKGYPEGSRLLIPPQIDVVVLPPAKQSKHDKLCGAV
jgi:hypothetical protein